MLQFFGMSHFRTDELSPLQSAMIVIPLICVNGSLSSSSTKMSSRIAESWNVFGGAIFPRSEHKINLSAHVCLE